MSLNVEGYTVPSAVFYPSPQSYISLAFYSSLPRVSGTRLLVTTNVPSQLLFSTPLDFKVSTTLETDVVLGFDWSSRVRDYLLMNGYRLDSTFDAWLYFSLPLHPLYHPSGPASALSTQSVTSSLQHTLMTASAHPDEPTRSNAAPGLIVPNSEPYSENFKKSKNSKNFETVNHSDTSSIPRARHKKFIHPKTPLSSKVTFIPYVPPSAGPSQSVSVPTEDVVSSVSSEPDSETRGHDTITRLFLSPDTAANVFTAGPATIFKLLDYHHVPRPSDMSLENGRISLICHLISGSCVRSCDPVFLENHICHCKNFASIFPTLNSMAFAVLSIILSASEERLPAPHHLAKHRRDLVQQHSLLSPNLMASPFRKIRHA
ncbi:hypothetical protein B0H16DRAFT_1892779 [Mycena metata]|uniref:Uncharacterized protein n=1 Tax=Mycena metata TaxID=1033252 RepID=A0AAD7MWB0_9AGAR|nr:hypothetical protein B0H16DRAFT_1892779 [Mycena metata]